LKNKVGVTIVGASRDPREHDPRGDGRHLFIGADDLDLERPLRTEVYYIEATTDAKFAIKCKLKSGFQLSKANCAESIIWVDGRVMNGAIRRKAKSNVKHNSCGWRGLQSGVDFWTVSACARRRSQCSKLLGSWFSSQILSLC
jgi:hypothetical protein